MTVIIFGRGQDYDGYEYDMEVVPNVGDWIDLPSGHRVKVTKRLFHAVDNCVRLMVRQR